jgi:hypothetical protein
MKSSLRALGALVLIFALTPAVFSQDQAQLDRADRQRLAYETFQVPALDNNLLLMRDAQRDDDGPVQFAEPYNVQLHPGNAGAWSYNEDTGMLTWLLRVQSPGAYTINVRFDRFNLPGGAQIRFYDAEEANVVGPFGPADLPQDVFEQNANFFSPLIVGDDIFVELTVPERRESALDLEIGAINHAYRPFGVVHDWSDHGYEKSGSCNVDVVCSEGDLWRDEIRSSARITISGMYLCSGALINNTAQDGTPYFLTADHCGITTSNDHTVNFYWNYENSTCRTPGSFASGQPGNGSLSQFSLGSQWRAAHSPSDMCLLEVTGSITSAFDVYLSGWDRSNTAPSSAVGIHHPSGDEKRISFEDDATTLTAYLSTGGTQNHIRVADWDLGTTEGGSSGSPLYNPSQLIVGQLHGGYAACGNNSADWYGRVYTSWTGGGTNSTRLSNWLDPSSTGATTMGGAELGFDLFMRDLPADDGMEPTVGGNMWHSPDIWVRQTQDATLSYMHQHQDPEFGQTNYVYVRIRNRGTATGTGTLHLYWSKASTGLNWPTHWNNYYIGPVLHGDQIGSQSVSGILPGDDDVYEFAWNPPDPDDFTFDKHHFCLLARFVSTADPMAVTEGTSTGTNTRNNNNIAWKNVQVYDSKLLNIGQAITTGLSIRNTLRVDATVRLAFELPEMQQEDPITDHVAITIDLGQDLANAIRRTGRVGQGMQLQEGSKVLIIDPSNAWFEAKLPAEKPMFIGVTLQGKGKLNEESTYEFNLVQYDDGQLAGGENYLIHAVEDKKDDGGQK